MRIKTITDEQCREVDASYEDFGDSDPAKLVTAHDLAPWAAKIARVEGGWMCFESVGDFATWSNQK